MAANKRTPAFKCSTAVAYIVEAARYRRALKYAAFQRERAKLSAWAKNKPLT